MSASFVSLIPVLLVFLWLEMQSALAWTADSSASARLETPSASGRSQSSNTEPLTILVLLSPDKDVNRLVRDAAASAFGTLDVHYLDFMDATSPDYVWPKSDTIVAIGRNGCHQALQHTSRVAILCTLLTEEGFRSLGSGKHPSDSASLTALVIDQPIARQAQVASRVYPSLTRFSAFAGSGTGNVTTGTIPMIDVFPYRSSVALPVQLNDALSEHDALIATSDSTIYNASTLSTLLLTAYGYGKPVIGFSRAYVKAGSLITCYSTPLQILRQVAHILASGLRKDAASPNPLYPDYFSVTSNPSVARSLGLISEMTLTAGQTYTDADFRQ